MFALSSEPLNPATLRGSVRNVAAGGFVAFEGWVRDHNEGRAVARLEYEAYEPLCLTEGNAILQEAMERFELLEARCVHRTGALALEDLAVWVGVCAPHRGEAFDACRHIIDAVKHRLPIWKKEYYRNGDSGWVNCERCAHAGAAANVAPPSPCTEADYYARQIQLKEVGMAGQEKLRQARVLVVGAGGLGSPVLQYLAAAGIGHLGIAESDTLDASNLHRQVLYGAADVGQSKLLLAQRQLQALNPFNHIHAHPDRVERDNVIALVDGYDILVDGTDNFETKFLLNDAAVLRRKLLVQASIYQYEGQLFVYDPAGGGPCFRCLWPEMPRPGCIGSCEESGVLGAVPGVLGALQAMEVLKQVLGLPGRLQGDTLFFDLLGLGSHKVRGERNPACPVCGAHPSITAMAPDSPVEIEAARLDTLPERYSLIDIRERNESARPLPGAACAIPASEFRLDPVPIDLPMPWVLVCVRGMRSKYLALALRNAGHRDVYSLRGGANALATPNNAGNSARA